MNRRTLLKSAALTGAAALLAQPARAEVTPEKRRFVFVTAYLGWDPTVVYSDQTANPDVHSGDGDYGISIGDLTYVGNDNRKTVSEFISMWADRCVIVNGIDVGSLSHAVCLKKMLTGSNSATNSDWGAILGASQSSAYGLPTVVVRGPGFTGGLAGSVCRIGSSGQIDSLLAGTLTEQGDEPADTFSDSGRQRIRDWARGRALTRRGLARTTREEALSRAGLSALERSDLLRSLRTDIRWGSDGSLPSQIDLATDLLANGLSRVVSIAHESINWDSHADNDAKQVDNFVMLFSGLTQLMNNLASVTTASGTLADETVVVVLSEMGRTPLLNAGAGKDHWHATSAFLIGAGLNGGRTIGAFDPNFAPGTVNFETGEADPEGDYIQPMNLGATLLTLGGVDPAEWLTDPRVVGAVLG